MSEQENKKNIVCSVLSNLFGSLSWQPAPWMQRSGQTVREQPSRLLFGLLLIAGLAALVKFSYDWYLSRPQDIVFQVGLNAPDIPALVETKTNPSPLKVSFRPDPDSIRKARERAEKYDQYQQIIPIFALSLEYQDQDSIEGIQMEPFIEGTWSSDKEMLYFKPRKYWPAETTYQITFPPKLFAEDIKLAEKTHKLITTRLHARIDNFKLHSDDNNPAAKRVIATLEFSHPVEQTDIEQALDLYILGKNGGSQAEKLDYVLSLDNETRKRRYYLNSSNIPLQEQSQYLELQLKKNLNAIPHESYLASASAQARLRSGKKFELTVPSIENFFKIESAQAQIVRDKEDNPQQVLIVELTDKTSLEVIKDHLEVYLLPPKNEDRDWERWTSASEIVPLIEEQGELLETDILPTEHEQSRLFSLVFDAPEQRQLFIKLKKGARSAGGYVASRDFRDVQQVPAYPKEVTVMGSGSILSRTGDHKVGFVSRGVSRLRVRINQVRLGHINHLITQTAGNFHDPRFNYAVSADNLSVVSERVLPLEQQEAGKPSYASLDLSAELNDSEINSGLFYLEVIGEDLDGRYQTRAQRMILITDIGFINKVNADRSQDVFVQSLSRQQPLAFASVSVLGKNGLSVYQTRTDEQGHAAIPNLKDFKREKQPIALLVQQGDDLAYLPVNQYARRLQTSRFDTGGIYWDANSANKLRAFLFTDRGIYRPGEKVRLGLIVKDHKLGSAPQFPVELHIENSRGQTVYKKKHRLPVDGFFEAALDTTAHSATGTYYANLNLMESDEYAQHLGSVTFQVEEFQPDRLKIKSRLQKALLDQRADADLSVGSVKGWIKPEDISFDIQLDNLFGTPAQKRKVSSSYDLIPRSFLFPDYEGYSFGLNPEKHERYTQTLQDQKTDEMGHVSIRVNPEKLATNSQLNFVVQGYEESGGRSVRTRNRILVSTQDQLIGLKLDHDLNYIKRSSKRTVPIQCINRILESVECGGLTLRKNQIRYVSTLVRQRNGTYQYQSIKKVELLSSEILSIEAGGQAISLDTRQPGKYEYQILDQSEQLLQSFDFQVAGTANLSAELEKDNQLEITLDKSEYELGDWVEIQLNAPYRGSGLISIEAERTRHFVWFTAEDRQTTQRIRVPDGLLGNAYINVAFVRAPDSREVLTTPLSYAVAPLKLSKEPYKLDLELQVADKAEPGKNLKISYRSAQSGRVALFAVDEGILQVAKYKTPDPLNAMLQKKALQVSSYQIFDLILPDFDVLKEVSAAGGGIDEEPAVGPAQNLNPFARKAKKPVVYWSGIVDVGPAEQSKQFVIPDHFDGTLRIMAVAVSDELFAHADEKVIVRGPFVVSPNVPLVVAPGDEFEVTVGVSNQLEGSGDNMPLSVSIDTSEQLNVIGQTETRINLSEGSETALRFKLKATESIGAADISFVATAAEYNASRKADNSISVRPAMPKNLTLSSGRFNGKEEQVKLERSLLETQSESLIKISDNPSLLIDGLISYLQVYPHACTEQIVSQVMPLVAFAKHPNYLGTQSEKAKQLNQLFASLQQRQLAGGGFALWPGSNQVATIPSVHTAHLLLDAQAENVLVPQYLLDNVLNYLREVAYDLDVMNTQPELAAYAIYLLTLSGEVTGSSLAQLEKKLKESVKLKDTWEQGLIAAYMAASYQLLKREDYAVKLMRQYRFKNARTRINRYDSSLYRDAMAMYLLAKHFPDEFDKKDTHRIEALIEPVLSGNINTMSSGRTLMALNAYAKLFDDSDITQSVSIAVSKIGEKDWKEVVLRRGSENSQYTSALLEHDDQNIRIQNLDSLYLYYQTQQNGYDRSPPDKPVTNGLEVSKRMLDANTRKPKQEFAQGEDVIIELRLRSSDHESHDDIALIDLVPGGFEIDIEATRNMRNRYAEYVDIREDRFLFYGRVSSGNTLVVMYKARVTASGEFTVPPAYANAMYDEKVNGHSAAAKVSVLLAK